MTTGMKTGAASAAAISRREAIRRAALLAGVALSPAWLSFAAEAQAPAGKTYLTAAQGTILGAVTERILPRTDTPGAIDVGVPEFIDRLYGEVMTPVEQKALAGIVEEIDAAATAQGSSFANLAAGQQDAVLRRVASNQVSRQPNAFELLRQVTILGYFTSEQVGKNVLHYDPVPGAYDGCVPIEQVGRRNWTT
jgi:hypothetical protein